MIPYTKLKDHNRQVLRDILPLAKPFSVIVEPSSLCNFRCVQCYQSICIQSYFTKARMNMPLELFSQVVEQLERWAGPKPKVLKLSMYGEPLMNPYFIELLRISNEAKIAERIETTTNASLLTDELAEGVVRYGLDYMRVSVYSVIQEKHERVTGSRQSIGQIRGNLLSLKRTKERSGSMLPFVSVKMLDTYSEENRLFVDTYKEVADETYFDKPHGWIEFEGKDFVAELYGPDTGAAREDVRRNSSSRLACPIPFFTLAVRSNGDVSPCCVDWIGETNLGNIRQVTLEEAWNSDRLHEFWRMQLQGRRAEHPSCGRCGFCASKYYALDDIDGFPIEKIPRKGRQDGP